MTLEQHEIESLDAILSLAARAVRRRWSLYTSNEDLVAEGWAWVMAHVDKVQSALAESPDGRANTYGLRRDVQRPMEKYARRQKAEALGYQVGDEYSYSTAAVVSALPAILSGSYDPPSNNYEGPRPKSDPAEGNGWLAVRCDVQYAWDTAKLTQPQRDALVGVYRDGMTQADVAAVMEVTQQAVSEFLEAALRKLCYALNTPERENSVDEALRRRPHGSASEQEPWR